MKRTSDKSEIEEEEEAPKVQKTQESAKESTAYAAIAQLLKVDPALIDFTILNAIYGYGSGSNEVAPAIIERNGCISSKKTGHKKQKKNSRSEYVRVPVNKTLSKKVPKAVWEGFAWANRLKAAGGVWKLQKDPELKYEEPPAKEFYLHHILFVYAGKGPSLEDGQQIAHGCHNTRCLNSSHIYASTGEQNRATNACQDLKMVSCPNCKHEFNPCPHQPQCNPRV